MELKSSDQHQMELPLPIVIDSNKHQPHQPLKIVSKYLNLRQKLWNAVVEKHSKGFKLLGLSLLIVLLHVHLIFAILYNKGKSLDWCNGIGFLIILVSIFDITLVYNYLGKWILRKISLSIGETERKCTFWEQSIKPLVNGLWVKFFILCILIGYMIYEAIEANQPRRLVSICGYFIILFFGFLLSKSPERINWDVVYRAFMLQLILGFILIKSDFGRVGLHCISDKVKHFLDYSDLGSEFVYGYLVSGTEKLGNTTNKQLMPVFAFKVLSVLIFFGFVISLLYHIGVIQRFMSTMGWVLEKIIGTTAVESMNVAASVLVGMTESLILIKPYLPLLTKSELHGVLTGGFSTVAGTIMSAYISFGISPVYLLTASIISAPGALGMAKLIYPETEKTLTSSSDIRKLKKIEDLNRDDNQSTIISAASHGAIQGITLISYIIANLIAFISLIGFLNGTMSWFGSLVGMDFLSFEFLLGKCFTPISYILGVNPEETDQVALLLGLKTIGNEIIAYKKLSTMTSLSPRSVTISTYALCSFANLCSLGIQFGGISALAPVKKNEIGSVIWYAFISSVSVGLLNAAIAGALIN